jgi:hypothetical protein
LKNFDFFHWPIKLPVLWHFSDIFKIKNFLGGNL